jgi:ABC-type transport system involved in cytochrome c biogenesis permease subunit
LLLAAAGLAQVLALLKVTPGPKRWGVLALAARLGSVGALAASVVLAALAHGEWSPADLRQVTLGLGLATVTIHLLLAWRLNTGLAGPAVDLVVLALVLVDALAIRPGGPRLDCAQHAAPYRVQWTLLLLGSGGAIVAGSAGLMHGVYRWLVGGTRDLDLPALADIHTLLRQATALTLLVLGGGIVAGAWWAWRTVGLLANDDPRLAWSAITWLAVAMSELAWRLKPQSLAWRDVQNRGRWPARLAMAAATTAILCLLAIGDVCHMLGT